MNTPWDTLSLPEISNLVWDGLTAAAQPGPHPWRTPVLSTTGARGPAVRTVVLRGFTRPGFELIAFSHAGAAKIGELKDQPESAWLFYDPADRVQLRVSAAVRLHTRDSVAQTYWHRLPEDQQGRYRADRVPGTPVSQPGELAPGTVGDEHQFAVLIATLTELDWLWLGPEVHRRARFHREEGDWRGHWIEP